ncbi:MAG: hypothetical protein ACRDSJ_09615 [Rubrobacteraceae bacterium]
MALPEARITGGDSRDRVEREISRLKAARPRLATRVERAEHIIVAQLSTAQSRFASAPTGAAPAP